MLYDMHCPVGPPLTPHHGDPLATPWEMLTAPHSAMQPLTLMSFKRFITFPLQQLLTVSKLEHLFDSGMRSRKNPIIKGTPKQFASEDVEQVPPSREWQWWRGRGEGMQHALGLQ